MAKLIVKTMLKTLFIAFFFCGLSLTFGACANDPSGSCDHKTRCLNDAISCLTEHTGNAVYNQSQDANYQRLKQLEQEIATLKAQLAKAGQPGGFAKLDQNGRLPQNLLGGGYDRYSAYDLGWQSLHMAAAAACRGSTSSGGSGCCENKVMVRNTADRKTCQQICAQNSFPYCDAEVSVAGKEGKATQNGQIVGAFYNYHCNGKDNGGSEATSVDGDIMGFSSYYSFCCCRR